MEEDNSPHKSASTKLAIIILVLLLGVSVNEIYLPHSQISGNKDVEISQGLGSRAIGDLLKRGGFIRSKWFFVIYASLRGEASSLKPGTYNFSDRDSIYGIVKTLVKGGTNETIITIPEGWTIKNIADYLENENIVRASDFIQTINPYKLPDIAGQFDLLKDKPVNVGLEGYLFPDTYRIFKGADAEYLILKMLSNFDRKLTPEFRQEIQKQHKTVFEIVTMASLIENEVVSEEDRAVVSGILWKRLDEGIPLQVDATIAFIKNQQSKNQNNNSKISSEDIKINSPYNTYKYRGLPLGPISNPGISAIKAAIYPQDSPYYYYLSTPDGKTIFSKTLDEQNSAKRKYLK